MNKLKKAAATISAAFSMLMLNISAFAAGTGGLETSKVVTGTQKLLDDITNVLLILAPVVAAACIIYFAIRHSGADEMDQKKWKQRMIVAAVSAVVAVLASALVKLLISYYQ